MYERLNAGFGSGLGSNPRPFDIYLPVLLTRPCLCHQGRVVMNHVDTLHRASDAITISDTALGILDFPGPRRVFPDV